MCQSKMHGFLAALPKCEHHMHLEGSLEPELVFELAARNGIALPDPATADPAFASPAALRARYARFTGLDDFLGYYYIAMSVLRTAADFEDLAYRYFAHAHAQGVRHAEVFFDPQAHTERGVALATVVDGFGRARARAAADFPTLSSSSSPSSSSSGPGTGAGAGLTTELIMCLLKHLPLAGALDTFAQARAAGYFADGTLLAVGMDSSEAPFPPPLWVPVYEAARAAGVRRTIHAGEEGPAACVAQALDLLDAQRIDHGIRVFLDADKEEQKEEALALADRLARQQTLLTMCPLSNVRLRCIPDVAAFPLRRLLASGVRFSVNSDDPAYFGGYVLENYCALQDAFGLTVPEWAGIARGALAGSWCGDARKAEIAREIDDVVKHWTAVLEGQ
ncbi:adenosine deaminase [Xylariaceae sp. FL0804]|nr:adenosine deaminase [Xylariaceae sp. FL0804]